MSLNEASGTVAICIVSFCISGTSAVVLVFFRFGGINTSMTLQQWAFNHAATVIIIITISESEKFIKMLTVYNVAAC